VTHASLSIFVCVLTSLAFTRCFAEVVPQRGANDARVRVARYAEDQVYRLHGFVGYAIHLQLEEGEEYFGLGSGDAEGITVDVSYNNVFVKPRALLVQTNFTLLTNRRRYHFDYTVGSATPNSSIRRYPLKRKSKAQRPKRRLVSGIPIIGTAATHCCVRSRRSMTGFIRTFVSL
jgi:type IV secretion system protein VirB9